MRRVLVEHARARLREKRGHYWQSVALATGVADCDSVRRYLAGLPVRAQPDAFRYRAG